MDNDIQEAKAWRRDLFLSAIINEDSNPVRYNELIRKFKLLDKLVKYMEGEKRQ